MAKNAFANIGKKKTTGGSKKETQDHTEPEEELREHTYSTYDSKPIEVGRNLKEYLGLGLYRRRVCGNELLAKVNNKKKSDAKEWTVWDRTIPPKHLNWPYNNRWYTYFNINDKVSGAQRMNPMVDPMHIDRPRIEKLIEERLKDKKFKPPQYPQSDCCCGLFSSCMGWLNFDKFPTNNYSPDKFVILQARTDQVYNKRSKEEKANNVPRVKKERVVWAIVQVRPSRLAKHQEINLWTGRIMVDGYEHLEPYTKEEMYGKNRASKICSKWCTIVCPEKVRRVFGMDKDQIDEPHPWYRIEENDVDPPWKAKLAGKRRRSSDDDEFHDAYEGESDHQFLDKETKMPGGIDDSFWKGM